MYNVLSLTSLSMSKSTSRKEWIRKLSLDIRESPVDLMFTVFLFVYLESNKFVFAWFVSKRGKDKSVKTKVTEYR